MLQNGVAHAHLIFQFSDVLPQACHGAVHTKAQLNLCLISSQVLVR